IGDVRSLRASQFPEDAGPLAHPIRPESYVEINNFYTATVYQKGAEVIRMMAALLGGDGFRDGMDLYFKRHDGEAVTCEDFVAAMENANDFDLKQFRLWYSQAGTPRLKFSTDWDADRSLFHVDIEQILPDTPDKQEKQPMHIPILVALFDSQGARLTTALSDGETAKDEHLLNLTARKQRFTFVDIEERVVLSLLRGFSAPVIVEDGYRKQDLAFLAAHDDDPFVKWESLQQLCAESMLDGVRRLQLTKTSDQPEAIEVDPDVVDAVRGALQNPNMDPALVAEAIYLPSETFLGDQMPVIAVDEIHQVRRAYLLHLAKTLEEDWRGLLDRFGVSKDIDLSTKAKAERRLRNATLGYYLLSGAEDAIARVQDHYHTSQMMTDKVAAIGMLAITGHQAYDDLLANYYERWSGNALVIDKWFSLQAAASRDDALERVMKLRGHPDFTLKNPNRCRSLISAFTILNPWQFHRPDGAGYAFLEDVVKTVDPLNPQLAARLVLPLGRWLRYDEGRSEQMKAALTRIRDFDGISKDTREMVEKSL
ncbi:MAG: DUF3458 domain-containing protein, partial [Pseudomonadota bacterium]